jgi:hypothetical protein
VPCLLTNLVGVLRNPIIYDKLKDLHKLFLNLYFFHISYIWSQSRYFGRGYLWFFSSFKYLYKI